MGRTEKTNFIKSQIIPITCNPVSHMLFHSTSVSQQKKPPSTRSKTRATRRKCLGEYSNKLRSSLHRSLLGDRSARSHASKEHVHPIPHPNIKEITDLEWIFDYQIEDYFEAWNTKKKIQQKKKGNGDKSGSPRPSWSQAPTSCPYRDVWKSACDLSEAWASRYHLQIPSSWSVFDNVDWMQDGSFRSASTDSEVDEDVSSGSSGSPPEPPRAPSLPIRSRIAVDCRGADLTRPRCRGQWNAFTTMSPRGFDWKYQTEERALRRNEARHTGYVDLNQQARNHDIWPQNSFPAVISHREPDPYEALLPSVRELKWPYMMGRWLAKVVETEMFPAQCEQQPVWPKSLMTGQASPNVDYICRATPQSIGWRADMCPVLFAAQHDPDPSPRFRGQDSVAYKLASVFQQTMVIFILYYLDTRANTDDPMPPWMALFGIHYNESGVVLREYSPCFQPSVPCGLTAKRGGWRATSSIVDSSHRHDLLGLPQYRSGLISDLNRIQGHCVYVLDRLKSWEGYERACQLLML